MAKTKTTKTKTPAKQPRMIPPPASTKAYVDPSAQLASLEAQLTGIKAALTQHFKDFGEAKLKIRTAQAPAPASPILPFSAPEVIATLADPIRQNVQGQVQIKFRTVAWGANTIHGVMFLPVDVATDVVALQVVVVRKGGR